MASGACIMSCGESRKDYARARSGCPECPAFEFSLAFRVFCLARPSPFLIPTAFLFCDSLISFYFLSVSLFFCCYSAATCRKPLGKISLGAANKPLESFVHCGGISFSIFLVFFSLFFCCLHFDFNSYFLRETSRSLN